MSNDMEFQMRNTTSRLLGAIDDPRERSRAAHQGRTDRGRGVTLDSRIGRMGASKE